MLVKRAVDRGKYPKALIYVDKQGNICKADRPQPLSSVERQKRDDERKEKYKKWLVEKQGLRARVQKAKKEVKRYPSVENAEKYQSEQDAYNDFKKTSWRGA